MAQDPPLTEYERYLHVPELLALQKSPAQRSIHEELHFQCVHQVQELHMKMALADLEGAAARMREGLDLRAVHLLHRVAVLEDLMTQELRVLTSLSPHEYYTIRAQLGRGSGQESPGFNRMLAIFPRVWEAFEARRQACGVTLRALYDDRTRHEALYALAEALLEVDAGFQGFRAAHVLLVKRIIGTGTPSLKGKPTELLERSMKAPMFEPLWKLRETIFDHFTPGPPVGDVGDPISGGHGTY